jgi:hypothetical protein
MGVAIVIVNHLRTVATLLHEILQIFLSFALAVRRAGWMLTRGC